MGVFRSLYIYLINLGTRFSHPRTLIVLTARSKEGAIANIRVMGVRKGVTYDSSDISPLINLDATGKLNLTADLDDVNTAKLNNTKFTVVAKKRGSPQASSTSVTVIILPLFFGDQFIPQVRMMKVSQKKNHPNKDITAGELLSFLRRSSRKARKILRAHLTLETRVMKIKKKIARTFGKEKREIFLTYSL